MHVACMHTKEQFWALGCPRRPRTELLGSISSLDCVDWARENVTWVVNTVAAHATKTSRKAKGMFRRNILAMVA